MNQEEIREFVDKMFNRDIAHLNCEVAIEPSEDSYMCRARAREFDLNITVVYRPGKPDENFRIEVEAARDNMIELVFTGRWKELGETRG